MSNLRTCACVVLLLTGMPVAAQNTAGVFGPVVNEGYRAFAYRAAHDFDSHGLAQRVQYQQAINGDFMWRAILQARKTDDSRYDTDFFQGELFWQLDDISDTWRHGVRFDVRIRTEGRPAAAGINWSNEFDLGTRWLARFVVLAAAEVGEGASGDLVVQTRSSATYRLRPGLRAGVEMFNTFGAIDNIPGYSNQFHQLGPTLVASLGSDWSLFAGALFGLSTATPDAQGRIWMTRTF